MDPMMPETGESFARRGVLCFLMPLFFMTGCIATTDFNNPVDQPSDLSAHVLPHNVLQVGIGVVGTGYDDLLGSLDLRYGLMEGLEVQSNLAHDLVGLLNLNAKLTVFEAGDWTMSARVGFKYIGKKTVWFLPLDAFGSIKELNLAMFPVSLMTTYRMQSNLQLHANLGYLHSMFLGTLEPEALDATAGFGVREVYLELGLTYMWNDIAFFALGRQPLRVQSILAGTTETEIAPGVALGVQKTGWEDQDRSELGSLVLGMEYKTWLDLRLRANLIYGLRLFSERVAKPLPSFAIYRRF